MFKQYQTASWPNDWSAWLTELRSMPATIGANPLGGNGGAHPMARCSSRNIRALRVRPSRRPWGGSSKFTFGMLFGELSGRQQEVFVLRYLEGWSTEEVARTLAISEGSVKNHLFRAVHKILREALKNNGDGS